MADPHGVNALVKFILERDMLRVRKERGEKRPWTKDPILDKYRFCNVRREDDAVTRWLRDNWYPHFADNPDLWFAAVVARLFNLPDSLEALVSWTLPFKPEKMRSILHSRKRVGKNNFNAAYIVSTNGVAMEKVDYIINRVLGPLWAARRELRPRDGDSLEVFHGILVKYDGLGSFIAAQIVADLKYIKECPLSKADDWMTFAASGPGSRRGLNRWRGYVPENPYKEREWRLDLESILPAVNEQLARKGLEPLHAQDLQNCLCEFDKYERARLGEGTPKQIYKEKK
jgi:hypothetical protein